MLSHRAMHISAYLQNKMRHLAHVIRLDFEGDCKKIDSFKHFDRSTNHLTVGLTIFYLLKDLNLMANEKLPDRAGKSDHPKQKCPHCDGKGKKSATNPYSGTTAEIRCNRCNGTGKI